jgi:hypothetical protein
MGSVNTYTKCAYCGRAVDPDAPGVVYAAKPERAPAGFGEEQGWVDAHISFFHPECPPEKIGYVRRQRPDSATET